MTQNERVIEYIKRFGSITTFEAFSELGITRLSARIFDLEAIGYSFNRETISKVNRMGDKVSFTRYSLA